MKLAFHRREENPTIGPFIFLERLIKYIGRQQGIEIVRNPGRFHELHFINISGSGRLADQWRAKKVLRIDGIYHDFSPTRDEQNQGIASTYHSVDGVIFQCEFARKMLYKHFGKPKQAQHETIICNGVDESFTPYGEVIDYGFPISIVVSGKWCWPSKRLPQMVDCFLQIPRDDIGLIILGEAQNRIGHPRIKYFGFIPPDKLPAYYRGATVMLHAAYTDWCPNSVVEALACGVPVITTHNGGVPEIIKGSGIIIKNEPDYDLEFKDFNNLPALKANLVAEAIDLIVDKRQDYVTFRPDLTIEYCGQQYLDFFKKVLNK